MTDVFSPWKWIFHLLWRHRLLFKPLRYTPLAQCLVLADWSFSCHSNLFVKLNWNNSIPAKSHRTGSWHGQQTVGGTNIRYFQHVFYWISGANRQNDTVCMSNNIIYPMWLLVSDWSTQTRTLYRDYLCS